MLYRKIASVIEDHLKSRSGKIMLIDGARQIGKTCVVRHVGQRLFKNFIEINMEEDSRGDRRFADVSTPDDFYLRLSTVRGGMMDTRDNTLIFIDGIQAYPGLLTLLKFLRTEDRYTYIASGSLLGVTLAATSSVPMGSIEWVRMYPLDFEEFLYANGYNAFAVSEIEKRFRNLRPLDDSAHDNLLKLFKRYLIVGGLPDAVNAFVRTHNVSEIRKVQADAHALYGRNASVYDADNKLLTRRIYDMIPSNLENRKKRVVYKDIENRKGRTADDYGRELEYLNGAGIALEAKAVSSPSFPLRASGDKSLVKLYLNDPGILANVLYKSNPDAVLDDRRSVSLGSVYENAVACELKAHGFDLFYYDNRSNGEADFLIDDHDSLSVLPIEVKSGKDYTIHHAINAFLANEDCNVKRGIVFSNAREVSISGNGIVHMPIYYAMFLKPNQDENRTI